MKFSTVVLSTIASAIAVSAEAIPYANLEAFAEAYAMAEAEALQHGSAYAATMGEVTIMYPPTREWSEDYELEAPCGSAAAITNRSQFALDDGFVALIAKTYNAWSISLKISYKNNPTTNDDFDEWANGNVTNDIDIGHTCFYMPDQPSSVKSGDNATIQLMYMAIEDNANVTHYACSDITFVEESVFKTSTYALSCFNATDDSYYSYSDFGDETVTSSSTHAEAATASTQSSSSTASSTSSSASSSTSAGAASTIAGISGALAVLAFNFLI